MISDIEVWRKTFRDVFGQGADISAANPLQVTDPAVSPAQGKTTANGVGGGTTVVDTARTEPDHFWEGQLLLITSGAYKGQVRIVNSWINGTGTFTVSSAFGGQILTGVTYKILASLGSSAGLTLAQLQAEVGTWSTRVNLITLLASLGIPDIAGKSLYTCLITDRLDNATFGLSAQFTNIGSFTAQLHLTTLLASLGIPDVAGKSLYTCLITDRLDNAVFGLSALDAEIGHAHGSTLGSIYAILGNPAQDLSTMIGYEGATSLAAKLTLTRAGYLDAAISSRSTLTLAQVQAEVGTFSGRTTLKTLLAILGWPDTVTVKTLAQILYVSDTELLKDFIAKTGGTVLPVGTSLYDQILTRSTLTLAQVQNEVGTWSGRANLKTLLAALGIPDTAGKPLYTCLITDRLDNATFGLSEQKTNIGAFSSQANLTSLLAALGIPDVAGKPLYTCLVTDRLDPIKTQTDKVPKLISSIDFWGPKITLMQLGATLQSNKALTGADVVIAGLPAGAVLNRVVVMFMCRAIENTNAGINDLQGAQNIQVNFSGGGFTNAIALPDEAFGVAASTREMGDAIVGAIDVKGTVTGNGTCTFQIDSARADGDFLNFNDYQLGIRVYYTL